MNEKTYNITKQVISEEKFREACNEFKKDNGTSHIRYAVMSDETFENAVKENDMHLKYLAEKYGSAPANMIYVVSLGNGKCRKIGGIDVLTDGSMEFGQVKFI